MAKTLITVYELKGPGAARVHAIKNGTFIRRVSGHVSSVYIKVQLNSSNQNIKLSTSDNCSVLLNIQTGNLRSVPNRDIVQVVQADLGLQIISDIHKYLK